MKNLTTVTFLGVSNLSQRRAISMIILRNIKKGGSEHHSTIIVKPGLYTAMALLSSISKKEISTMNLTRRLRNQTQVINQRYH